MVAVSAKSIRGLLCLAHLFSLTGSSEAQSGAMPSNALVLYDESNILRQHQPEKEFNFGNLRINIKQNWEKDGVAGIVWDAAIVLCEYLVNHAESLRDQMVLELGAGTGLVGICAAKQGARVTLTDRASVLPLLKENSERNGVECLAVTEEVSQSCIREDNSELDGECKEDNSDDGMIYVAELDWYDRENQLYSRQWDYVIGADVIYIEETFPHLLKTMKQLKTKNLILSCRLRYEKDHRFITAASKIFNVVKLIHDKPRDIYIYKFMRL